MKTALNAFAAIFVAFFLAGCATGPKFSEISSSINEPAADKGRIYIYRTAVLGAAVQPEVKLNGEVVGKAVPNGFFYVDRGPGDLSLTLDKDQTRYVRLNISMGFFVGHVYPELVENSVGKQEIQQCSYTGQ
jgi:hypothetical protein